MGNNTREEPMMKIAELETMPHNSHRERTHQPLRELIPAISDLSIPVLRKHKLHQKLDIFNIDQRRKGRIRKFRTTNNSNRIYTYIYIYIYS